MKLIAYGKRGERRDVMGDKGGKKDKEKGRNRTLKNRTKIN